MKSVITNLILCCQFLAVNGMINEIPKNMKRSKSLGDVGLLSDTIIELKKQTTESIYTLQAKGQDKNFCPNNDVQNLKNTITKQKEKLIKLLGVKLNESSYLRTEYDEYTKKLVHLLSLDQNCKPIEVRFVNAENIIKSFRLPEWKENTFLDLLHSKKSLESAFKESCICTDKKFEKELLDIINDGSEESQIFRDVMICIFALSQSNLLPKNINKIAFEKIDGIESFCTIDDEGNIQLGDTAELYIRSVFKKACEFSLESANIFSAWLPKKLVLFHESGHGISTFFDKLPLDEEILPYENYNLKMQEIMNPQAKTNYNIVSKISPTEVDNKNLDDALSKMVSENFAQDNAPPLTQLLKEIIDLFVCGKKEYIVNRNEVGEIVSDKITKKNYLGEVTYEVITNYSIVRKEKKHVKIDPSEPYNPSFRLGTEYKYHEGKCNKTIQRKTHLNKNNEIIKEEVIEKDETGKITWEGIIEYEKADTLKSTNISPDDLQNLVDLGKSIIKKYAFSPEVVSEFTFSRISEVWQILGLICVENRDKITLYINELSDFSLYSSLGLPIRFDHCGGTFATDSGLFYPNYIKVSNINWELYDTLFKLHGSSLNQYLDKLTNGKVTTLEQYMFNLLYPQGLSSLLKNEYRLMKPLKNI